jgi:hypothetical protein
LPNWPAWAKRRWLLITAAGCDVVDGEETPLFSAMFPQLHMMPTADIRSQFDRVYFLDLTTDKVVRLS